MLRSREPRFVPKEIPSHVLYLCKIENNVEFGDSKNQLIYELPLLEIWPIDIAYLFDKKGIKVLKNAQTDEHLGPFYVPMGEFIHELDIKSQFTDTIDKQWKIPNVYNANDEPYLYCVQTDLISHQSTLYSRELSKQTISKSFGKVCHLITSLNKHTPHSSQKQHINI